MRRGLLDTSVLIARESGRRVDDTAIPDELFVSVVTLAELRAGVLAAVDTTVRARRLATLEEIASLEPSPIDGRAAAAWATMRVALRSTKPDGG